MKHLYDYSIRQLSHVVLRRLLSPSKLIAFDEQHPCVFVLSTGRVGSETLAALFSLARNIFAYHEPAPKLYGLSKLAYEKHADLSARKVLTEAFLLSRKELLDYSLDCGRGYIETSPQVTFLAPHILEVIPSVRFIHLVRDPREIVRSGMRRNWFNGNRADKTRILPPAQSNMEKKWGALNPFQKNVWLWSETNRWIQEFCSTLPTNQTLLVHSEDIFQRDRTVLQTLFSFIGAPLPKENRLNAVLGQKLNAQKTGNFPDVSDWSDEMRQDLEMIAGATAQSLHYTLSPSPIAHDGK